MRFHRILSVFKCNAFFTKKALHNPFLRPDLHIYKQNKSIDNHRFKQTANTQNSCTTI